MAFLRKQRKLISFDQAAEILGINANTIRLRLCGTRGLTHVPTGGRRVLLIEDDVLDLQARWIRAGEEGRPDAAALRLVGGLR